MALICTEDTYLFQDVDRRVREATHCANEQICVKAGRQLAAHLRLIMPCWLCTMSDPHPPAARASQAAFTATLTSDSKRADALVYCKDAIFNVMLRVTHACVEMRSRDACVVTIVNEPRL